MKESNDINGYSLSRNYFDWAFENPSKNNPTMTALYFFLVEVNNRLGWKKEFGVTPKECMDALSIGSYNTYKKNFDHLVKYGFIDIVKKSINQHQCNIIALSKNDIAPDKALDKAVTKHLRHSINNETINTIVESDDPTNELYFENIWLLYGKKGNKKTSMQRWNKLSKTKKRLAIVHIPLYVQSTPDKKYRKDLQTYINQEAWNDEVIIKESQQQPDNKIVLKMD